MGGPADTGPPGTQGVFGLHAVVALLSFDADRIQAIWVQDSRREDQVATVLERAARLNIAVEVLPRRALDGRLPGLRHQGLVAWALPAPRLGEADLQVQLAEWGETEHLPGLPSAVLQGAPAEKRPQPSKL